MASDDEMTRYESCGRKRIQSETNDDEYDDDEMTSRDTKAEDEHEHKDGAKRKTHDDEYADDNGGDADRRGDEEIRKLRTKTNTKTGRRRKLTNTTTMTTR